MTEHLSFISPIEPNYGKAQWVECKPSGILRNESLDTSTCEVPYLMPCTIIFVHGVNSDGEWYKDASKLFGVGLNKRLGRSDMSPLLERGAEKRFLPPNPKINTRVNSPIIPFYWGYAAPKTDCLKDCSKNVKGTTDVWTDTFGNPLSPDGSWGGGPFANGTNNLRDFWHPGFRFRILNEALDLNKINPILGRQLFDCPDRLYYVHAAQRLAHLIKTIRADFPEEPINIVSHSQGTMVALCSQFYMDGVRGADTVMLNSSPYRFNTTVADFLTVANGKMSQTSEERISTFQQAAAIVKKAKGQYAQSYKPAEFDHEHEPQHAHDDATFAHHDPQDCNWQKMIGGTLADGKTNWWQSPRHARDNRGNLYINFNPGDRVIGVSVLSGIGWCGIGAGLLSDDRNKIGAQVFQRMFARNSGTPHIPSVGGDTLYTQHYFHSQMEKKPVEQGEGGEGTRPEVLNQQKRWVYMTGHPSFMQWRFASEEILRLIPVLGSLYGGPWAPLSHDVFINSPLVPKPLSLPEAFDADLIRFDGQADANLKTRSDEEAQADFSIFAMYSPHEDLPSCKRGEIDKPDERGLLVGCKENHKDVEERLRQQMGDSLVSPTNHSAILRFGAQTAGNAPPVGPVSDVLSYDLTVGLGYAWGDEDYWAYLWKLADWKLSDPYFLTGVLDDSVKAIPPEVGEGWLTSREAAYTQSVFAPPAPRDPYGRN